MNLSAKADPSGSPAYGSSTLQAGPPERASPAAAPSSRSYRGDPIHPHDRAWNSSRSTT